MTTPSNTAREQLNKLAEALYRFSQSLDSSFASHLRQVAVQLAGALAADDEKEIAGILQRAKGVIALGVRVGVIAANDADVIAGAITRSRQIALPVPAKRETASKKTGIEEFSAIARTHEEEVPAVAASEPVKVQDLPIAEAPKPVAKDPALQPAVSAETPRVSVASLSANAGAPSAADRQARIIAAIRQNPDARMRDLLVALQGVSERTIRYDLERLVASGAIEREGIGGPATRYRLRESVTR